MAMLNSVKIALRRADTSVFDAEISELIDAALLDLGIAGVDTPDDDPLVLMAVKTYCKMHFGETDEYDKLKKSYDEQKAQLQMSSPYTNYSDYGLEG